MRLLGIGLELRLEGGKLGERRIGIRLLLALPARAGIPAILGIEAAVLLVAISYILPVAAMWLSITCCTRSMETGA